MSARTSLAVLDQSGYPEEGPSTKALENFDVTNGSKFLNDGITALQVRNTTGGALTLTFTYDERNRSTTKVTTLGANAETILGPFPTGVFNQHAADGAEHNAYLWVTASGTTGQLQGRAIRLPR